MVDNLVREGIPGAGDRTERGINNQPPAQKSDSTPKGNVHQDAVEDLLAWLDEEDYLDEGTVVVIGRSNVDSKGIAAVRKIDLSFFMTGEQTANGTVRWIFCILTYFPP
jgi:hypothetical protein